MAVVPGDKVAVEVPPKAVARRPNPNKWCRNQNPFGQLRPRSGLCGGGLAGASRQPKGAVIIQALPNSQAERLGLKAGDVISHYSGKTITSAAQLIGLIARTQGHDIPLEIIRDGKRLRFAVAEGKLGVKL